MKSTARSQDFEAVNRAFSRQSTGYDSEDERNPILSEMRQRVYAHVGCFLKPGNAMLELNAGSGIDAFHFASQGYRILATDLADGMIAEIENKIRSRAPDGLLAARQLSYDHLEELDGMKFNYVFSNFGGLNCIDDLSKVTAGLDPLLTSGAFITWVVMPPVSFWEWLGMLKGNFRTAFRRMRAGGVISRLEGEHFMTYYHSLRNIRKAFGKDYELVRIEGLCVISPPPHRGDFPTQHKTLYSWLKKMDVLIKDFAPFNRTGDHIIVTLKKR